MKRALFILCLCLFFSIDSFSQTFQIDSYRWGSMSYVVSGRGMVWGRPVKADFDIVLDTTAGTIEFKSKKNPAIYEINGDHPEMPEFLTPDINDVAYCYFNEIGERCHILIRKKNDKAVELIKVEPGRTWKYHIASVR